MMSFIAECTMFAFLGFICEKIFTFIISFFDNKKNEVSKKMFFVYLISYAILSRPIGFLMNKLNTDMFIKSLIVVIMVYISEYTSGYLLRKFWYCPWKYDHHIVIGDRKYRVDVNGLISFLYLPFWSIFAYLTGQYYYMFNPI